MWRLIVVTFGFLGWAFYVLSGGADYVPSEGSRQQIAALQASQPAAPVEPRRDTPTAILTVQAPNPTATAHLSEPRQAGGAKFVLASATATTPAPKPRADVPLSDAEKRLRLTLNGEAPAGMAGVATVSANPEKIARLVAAAAAVRPANQPQPTAAAAQAQDGRDLRNVSASRVNMRQGPGTDFNVVAKLTQGTEVEVLRDQGDGWVKLRVVDSGRVGWMADHLLTASN
ncbi:MAG: SH3 domain-containing protein [Paracoccaceae bacterium]